VPTYNEIENIETLVARVTDVRAATPVDVLFVDDGSPDGTGARIHELRATRPWISIVEREGRQGLGSAYRTGFRWGLAHGYARIGEMDADLSHDPSYLTALDAAARAGADLALGSRYTRGGGSEGWP
jgi:dolichol-phosphate mannosyltransferase